MAGFTFHIPYLLKMFTYFYTGCTHPPVVFKPSANCLILLLRFLYQNLSFTQTRCHPFHSFLNVSESTRLISFCLCCRRYLLTSISADVCPELPLLYSDRFLVARILFFNLSFIYGFMDRLNGFSPLCKLFLVDGIHITMDFSES